MKINKIVIFSLVLLVGGITNGFGLPDTLKGKTILVPDTILLKKYISTLSADAMEGRETGTPGEKMAYEYLIKEFSNVGLLPKGTQGYIFPFPFNAGSYMGPGNTLKIGKKNFNSGEQFYPLAYSANKKFEGKSIDVGFGIPAPGRDDYQGISGLAGKIFVMEIGYPEGFDPHSRLAEYADLRTRIDSAIAKGAVAVIFKNTDKNTEDPASTYSNRITPSSIRFCLQKLKPEPH